MSVDGLLVFADVFTEWTFVVLSSASLKLFSLSLKLRQNKLGFVPCLKFVSKAGAGVDKL
jgi:hypothetical protein